MRPLLDKPEQVKSTISKDKRIAVLCGGLSSERDVSLRSGKNCQNALHRLGYHNAILIDVGRDIAQQLTGQRIEIAFLALHGKYGEDGCIQGLLEILGIPYTGNGVEASALTMNKDLTKKVLHAANLPVIPSITLNMSDVPPSADSGYKGPFPAMVKPVSEGSSIGMSKVNTPEALQKALESTGKDYPTVMIEQFIPGKSVTVGVIDIQGKPTATPILELRTKTEWYDLQAKYTEGLTEFILPAELSPETTRRIQETTLAAHKAAGCQGLSRIDFVVDADNRYYILEINTIPGMTDLSDLPAQAKAMGIAYDQLVEIVLQTAYARLPVKS